MEEMIRITASHYRDGIESLKVFTKMLREALEEVLDPVKLSRESAYSWRGYQIEECQGLKKSQYYCQIELYEPYILAFFEYFDMTHYPFKAQINLMENGFFQLASYGDQKQILIDFIRDASTEAKAWNVSPVRKRIVPKRKQ